ncbi:hypothetical protein [Pelagibacterium xiamenense]|uniref:hypothetical protein n=1 Tax=Pelagibacterium xiamenense TaxID=2901140 RepID=UPI001E5F1F1F|nr:hypothetical protein [Pelagibacterium xiamenense]MCD7060316.1 hypothetical protein [Pelagibacterium xiamenense]
MSAFNVARNAFFIALAASRHPVVREAIRNAPRVAGELVSEESKRAAREATMRAARKAGELTARIVPPNRYF